MKKVFVIHGYGGYPEKNWFPWLKVELEKLGVSCEVLKMPNTDNPKFSEWLEFLQKEIKNPNENYFLVGHSLGCIAIVQFLNHLKSDEKIGGAVLVAGFVSPIHFHELDGFFKILLDEKKIIKTQEKLSQSVRTMIRIYLGNSQKK